MAEKAKQEGIAEADTFEAYTHWCGKTTNKLKAAIEKETKTISSLEAKTDSKKEEAKLLGREIAILTEEVEKLEASAKEAADQRKKEKEIFEEAHADLLETAHALQTAVLGLISSKDTGPKFLQAEKEAVTALLQHPVATASMTEDEQTTLLKMTDDAAADPEATTTASPLSGSGPAARTYDFKSGKITDMLKKMKIDYENKAHEIKSKEQAAQTTYDAAKGAKDEELLVATESKGEKTKISGEVESTLAQLSTDLSSTKEDLAADSKNLQDTSMSCKIKTEEFNQRVYMRKQEQEAFAFGIKILAKVVGVRTAVPSFLQVGVVSAHRYNFMERKGHEKKIAAMKKLREVATKYHERELLRGAMKAEAHVTAPGVAKNLNLTLQKQLWALKDEQLAEDKKFKWCQTEMNKTTDDIERKTEEMKNLKDETQIGKATVEELLTAIEDANEAIYNLKESMHEATLIRQDEKTENSRTIEDAQDAQEALKNAIATLEKYYNDANQAAASAPALIQGPAETVEPPATWDKSSYTGSESGNIMSVLQETSADFGKVETETQAKEEQELSQFTQDMKDDNNDVAKKESDVKLKTEEKVTLLKKMEEWTKTYKITDREKELLIQYNKDLNAECSGGEGGSYEDRKAAREEEMESLQSAQKTIMDAFKKPEASNLMRAANSAKTANLRKAK
eukprot:TRINITY_DN9251_c0_g1_i1.p1 TRINITY_DN9251_c0_g1~~TRINITY_DN9251_c0_g1_i1.p1  ORF type:complete len:744 (-),score=254.04 TRINITY_DN9251_c0_g1_i1:109-2154(-)